MAHHHKDHEGGGDGQGMEIGKGLMAGMVSYAGYSVARGFLGRLAMNPLVLFSVGAVCGAVAYKYRNEILKGAAKTIGAGKDFVLEQKEKLSDIVAEAQEEEEDKEKNK